MTNYEIELCFEAEKSVLAALRLLRAINHNFSLVDELTVEVGCIGSAIDILEVISESIHQKAKGEEQSQPNALRDDVYVAGGKA